MLVLFPNIKGEGSFKYICLKLDCLNRATILTLKIYLLLLHATENKGEEEDKSEPDENEDIFDMSVWNPDIEDSRSPEINDSDNRSPEIEDPNNSHSISWGSDNDEDILNALDADDNS